MVVLTLVASALNYGSNVVFSRVLDPAGYGELTALFALSVVLAVPTAAAQTVIAQRITVLAAAGAQDRISYLVRYCLAHVAVLASVTGIVYLAATPLVGHGLGLRHPAAAVALTPVIVLAFVQPVALGVLQGLERFTAYGLVLLAIALSRIVFGLPAAALAHGAGGALVGQGVGMLVVLGCVAWVLRDLIRGRGRGAAGAGLRRRPDLRSLTASAAFIGFALLSNLDLVLAKAFLSPHQAGVYAALSTIGKVIVFLPAAIAVVMVPRAARAQLEEGSGSQVLRTCALLVGGTSTLAAIPAVLAPHLIVAVMFGSRYAAAAGGVLPMMIAGAGLALTYLLVVYTVAIGDRRWMLLLMGAVAVQIAGIALFHHSPTQVATVQATVALLVLGANELLFHPILLVRPVRGRPLCAA